MTVSRQTRLAVRPHRRHGRRSARCGAGTAAPFAPFASGVPDAPAATAAEAPDAASAPEAVGGKGGATGSGLPSCERIRCRSAASTTRAPSRLSSSDWHRHNRRRCPRPAARRSDCIRARWLLRKRAAAGDEQDESRVSGRSHWRIVPRCGVFSRCSSTAFAVNQPPNQQGGASLRRACV